ncbi:MAG: molybdate ABC transporter permease subunit [Polyangiaceae bacterium]
MPPLAVSMYVALCATVLSTLVGVALAAWLERIRGFVANAVELVLTLPLVLPPTVLGYYLLVALGRESAIGHAYERIFGTSIVFTRTGAIVGACAGAIPLVLRQSRAALRSVDPIYAAAARSLGATRFRTFLTVDLPLAKGGIVAAAVLAFARSLGDFGVTLMVSGSIPGETKTASIALYDALASGEIAHARTLAITLTAAAAACLVASAVLTRRARSEDPWVH